MKLHFVQQQKKQLWLNNLKRYYKVGLRLLSQPYFKTYDTIATEFYLEADILETVLIADDELNIREGIKLIIDWESLGFRIVGDASNGEEALSAIMKLNPTLVVMDMQMPKIHGIDVIRLAREQGYEGYFIILSGYSDFSYAKEAIRNRVTNYITKPIDEDELYATVQKIRGEIEKNAREGGRIGKMRTKAKNVVVNELLMGTYLEDDEKEHREESLDELEGMGLLCPEYQVVIHETYHAGKSSAAFAMTELLPAFLEESQYETCDAEGFSCILLKGKSAIARFEDFLEHYEKAPVELDSPLDMIFLAIGQKGEKPEDVALCFESAKKLAKRRFFCEEGQHFVRTHTGEEEQKDMGNPDKAMQQEVIDKLSDAAIGGNRRELIETLESLTESLKKSTMDTPDVCLYLTEILLQCKDRLTKQYPSLAEQFESHAGIIEFIEGRFYLYEIIQYMTELFDRVMEKLHERSGNENIIEDILSYTERNYALPLTLEDLANQFGYNSGYLGRLFTRTMGIGYNYYLNECRIKKSKELLLEGKHKVYEVAELVGYNDVDYFGKKFRKHAGMTPAEFKKQGRRTD